MQDVGEYLLNNSYSERDLDSSQIEALKKTTNSNGPLSQNKILNDLEEMESLKRTVMSSAREEADDQVLAKLERMIANMSEELGSLEQAMIEKKAKALAGGKKKTKGKIKSPKRAGKEAAMTGVVGSEQDQMIEEISNQVADKLKNMFEDDDVSD